MSSRTYYLKTPLLHLHPLSPPAIATSAVSYGLAALEHCPERRRVFFDQRHSSSQVHHEVSRLNLRRGGHVLQDVCGRGAEPEVEPREGGETKGSDLCRKEKVEVRAAQVIPFTIQYLTKPPRRVVDLVQVGGGVGVEAATHMAENVFCKDDDPLRH